MAYSRILMASPSTRMSLNSSNQYLEVCESAFDIAADEVAAYWFDLCNGGVVADNPNLCSTTALAMASAMADTPSHLEI